MLFFGFGIRIGKISFYFQYFLYGFNVSNFSLSHSFCILFAFFLHSFCILFTFTGYSLSMIFPLTSSIKGAQYVSFPSPILFGSLCPIGRIDSYSRNSFFLPFLIPFFPAVSIPLSLPEKEKSAVFLLPPLPYSVYSKLLFRKSSLPGGKGKHWLYPSFTGCTER